MLFWPVIGFELNLFVYKLNLFCKKTTVGLITKVETLKYFGHSELRYFSCATHEPIKNAGWHFSFLDDTDGEKVLKKYKSWAHSRDDHQGKALYFNLESKEQAVKTLFAENNPYKQLENINYNTHPKCLVDNIEKYKNFIYP